MSSRPVDVQPDPTLEHCCFLPTAQPATRRICVRARVFPPTATHDADMDEWMAHLANWSVEGHSQAAWQSDSSSTIGLKLIVATVMATERVTSNSLRWAGVIQQQQQLDTDVTGRHTVLHHRWAVGKPHT